MGIASKLGETGHKGTETVLGAVLHITAWPAARRMIVATPHTESPLALRGIDWCPTVRPVARDMVDAGSFPAIVHLDAAIAFTDTPGVVGPADRRRVDGGERHRLLRQGVHRLWVAGVPQRKKGLYRPEARGGPRGEVGDSGRLRRLPPVGGSVRGALIMSRIKSDQELHPPTACRNVCHRDDHGLRARRRRTRGGGAPSSRPLGDIAGRC